MVKTLANTQVKVLAMKLQLPNLPLHHVQREQLMLTFSQNDSHSIHVLSAASGYGKTLGLAQWLHHKRAEQGLVSWLTLDEKENDPKRFVTYLVSAFNQTDENLAPNALTMLVNGEELDDIVDTLISDLNEYPSVLHFAVDDLHHINNPVCIEYLQRLLKYAPHIMRFYFITQRAFPFHLSSFVGQGRCAKYDEYDFRLSLVELNWWREKFAAENLKQYSSENLFSLSQGWFAGLSLIEAIFLNAEQADVFGNEQILVDYFNQQWRPLISDEAYDLCLCLATLKKANGLYVDYVFKKQNSVEALSALNKQHVFVLHDENQNDWFYLHPLLERYLSNLVDDTELSSELERAGQWLDQHNYKVAAVDMAFRGNNFQQAASLLETTAQETFEKHDLTLLLKWKKQLSDSFIITSPKLVILFSWTLAFAQQFDEAERLLAQMDGIFSANKSSDDEGVSGQLFAIRGYIARCRGKMSNAIQLCNQALEKLEPNQYVARSITYFNLSNVYMSQDKLALSRQYNRLSFETARAVGSIHLEMQALHEHARIEQVRGNLHLSEKLLNEGLALANGLNKEDLSSPYGRLLIYKGYILWLKNQTQEAQGLLYKGMAVANRCRDAYIIMAYVLLNNIARHEGNIEKAYDLLAQAEAKLQYWSVPGFVFQPWLATMRVNLQIDENKIDTAINNLKLQYSLLNQNEYALSPEYYPGLKRLCDVFLVRAKSISGQHAKALKLLDKKLEHDGDSQQGFSLIFSLLMRALLRYQLGQEDNALHDFRRAIVLAEKNYCIMPFIEYSQSMLALYDQLPASIQEMPFVQAIRENLKVNEQPEHNVAFAKIRTIISQRELGVLKLMAEGLSNQDIAERLFISLHTVKTHARRINAKLGVKNRTQAIIKAREMGVI